jgi:hypothetical protein
MALFIQTAAFDPLDEFVSMIYVEDENAMSAIFQVVADAGTAT